MNKSKVVYILGAGCSADPRPTGPGFPQASGFVSALDGFSKSLAQNCERLRTCVHQTLEILRRERAQTVDTLVARLASEAHDFTRVLTQQDRHKLDQQIQDAKIATAALFMDLGFHSTICGSILT